MSFFARTPAPAPAPDAAALEIAFDRHVAERNLRAIRLGAVFGAVLVPSGVVLDWATHRDAVPFLFAARVAAALVCGAILWLTYRPRAIERTFALGAAVPVVCAIALVVMMERLEGYASPYYGGLGQVLLAVGVLYYLKLSEIAWVCAAVIGVWLLPALRHGRELDGGAFFNTLYALTVMAVIAAASSAARYRAAFREFAAQAEVTRTSNELSQALERLKELDRAKNQFFANISHELRTPLTLILGALESLLATTRDVLNERQVEYLEIIRRNGLSLLRLINDLLDLARLEAAQARLRLESVDVAELVRGITLQAEPMLAWRQLVLERELPAAPLWAPVDALKIEKVVLNLLSNAIKFTPRGGRVRVRLEERGEWIRFEVTDTGIGIPPDELERIFERFSQVEADSTRSRGGTGIGLALVREFVELHAGRVHVTSTLGSGSTFAVELPRDAASIPEERIDRRVVQTDTTLARREADQGGLGEWVRRMTESAEYRWGDVQEAADRREAHRIDSGPRRGTVLIVEDSRNLRRFLSLQLATEFRVLTAGDGEEGWQRTRADRPDVVVTDLMMPLRDGHWLVEQVRADPETRETPIIMLTARGLAEDRVRAREGGADVFLAKPFHVRELHAAIDRMLARKRERVDSLQSETATSMRVLTAGVAHELLNPLGFISNALYAIREILGDVRGTTADRADVQAALDTSQKLMQSAQAGVTRLRTLVDELRSVAHQHVDAMPESVDLNELVRSTVTLIGAEANPRVRLDVALSEPALVHGRPGPLGQVLLNLCINALHALPEGRGTIWLATRARGASIELVVRDDGVGIRPEHLERVFDPFFTTKGSGQGAGLQGSGLGLALCKKIVEEHHGTLTLASVPGEGTTVVMTLPAIATDDRAAGQASLELGPPAPS